MVLEDPALPFFTWLLPNSGGLGALLTFLITSLVVGLAGVVLGYLMLAFQYGPVEAFFRVMKIVLDGIVDLARISPRRVWAMTTLAFKESIRLHVLVTFAIFLLILLFAGWFLDTSSDHPAKLYLSFVIPWSTFLILLLALMLSTFSIPNDIKNRTIFTVMTKPVVAWEIILGRIFGFVGVCTMLLAVMCLVSFIFVVRGLAHRHEIDPDEMLAVVEAEGDESTGRVGPTSYNRRHRHEKTEVDAQGQGFSDMVQDHRHPVVRTEDGEYHVGQAKGNLTARVPIYGKLHFLDRKGRPSAEGVNVGNEWAYRSFVEGRTNAAAIWRFKGIDESDFPDNKLPLEMTIRVFRTHKGEITRGVIGSITLHNPNPAKRLQSRPIQFESQEFAIHPIDIPRNLKAPQEDGTTRDIDLFRDLVDNGELEIRIQCEESQQYFGMAQPDLYLRASDGWFSANFAKTYFSIWCQMVLVIAYGVLLSVVLSGAVAFICTLGTIVFGIFSWFITDVASGIAPGGGPTEAAYRIWTQDNLTSRLEESVSPLWSMIMKGFDAVVMFLMSCVVAVVPEYWRFDTSDYVVEGFRIPLNVITQQGVTTFAFVMVIACLGYFLLKSREIAA